MDMRIAGRGNIPAGEYNKVSGSGSIKLFGNVRCVSFSSAGSSKGENIECAENFKASGSSSFLGSVRAKNVKACGSFFCAGNLTAEENIIFKGKSKIEKSVKCNHLSSYGLFSVMKNIEAENVVTAGVIKCEGLVNAENITIKTDKISSIGSIGGSNITVKRKKGSFFRKRKVIVSSAIEGDNIFLDHVTAPRVTGRIVSIGKGSVIELVQYSEKLEISPRAKVLKTEKI